MRRNGPFGIRAVAVPYRNPWIRVEHHDVVRPDGEDGVYGIVRFANLAVGVLPLFDDGTTVLVGQHRFPFDAYSWELPEGGGPLGEPPEATARRELAEETGLRAKSWAPLGRADLSNSVTDERAVHFLAWDLSQGDAAPDGDEALETRRVPFAELVLMCHDGRVTDALTQLMVGAAIGKAHAGLLPSAPAALILEALEGARHAPA